MIDELQKGTLLLTPTNRLASEITNDFYVAFQKNVQEKPHCYTYSLWRETIFHVLSKQVPSMPLLLSNEQGRLLWQEVLQKENVDNISASLIEKVEQAWNLLVQYELDLNDSLFSNTEETSAFQAWARAFSKKLEEYHAITSSQIEKFLISHLKNPPKKLVFYCFDTFTPLQKSLQKALTHKGSKILIKDLEAQEKSAIVLSFNDENTEFQALIEWIQLKRESGAEKIGVIIPELATQYQKIERRFLRAFPKDDFHLSSGTKLSDYALISHGLSLISLSNDFLDVSLIRLLLTSPYLGDSHLESEARFFCLQNEKLVGERKTHLKRAIREIEKKAPKLAMRLKNLSPLPKKGSIPDFIDAISDRLNALGFPGEEALSSETWQCFQRFLSLFDTLRSLSLIKRQVSQDEIIRLLNALAHSTSFQAEKRNAPIEIMGLLESSGSHFDALWVMGLNDETLPPSLNRSPFLPASLQKEKSLPHASITNEYTISKSLFSRLKKMSGEVVFSLPMTRDGNPCLPSLFLLELPFQQGFVLPKPHEKALVSYSDPEILPFLPMEKKRGGSSLLAYQAQCPFRAFSAYRLGLKPLPLTEEGLSPLIKGQIIHKVFELFWGNLKCQSELLKLSLKEIENQIDEIIEEIFQAWKSEKPHAFPPLLQEIEKKRLKKLSLSLIEEDKKRPLFKISALEETFSLILDELELTLRIDRLDETFDGQKWVIDYKTSLPATLPFKQERPEAPQLLLYALLDEDISTLAYAELKANQIGFSGFSKEKTNCGNIRAIKEDETWESYQSAWKIKLTELAKEYIEGFITPNPENQSRCMRCEFKNVCRSR